MNEKIILLTAFVGALFGLLALFFLSENLDYSEKTIEKINEERIEDMIKVEGQIVDFRNSGNVTFISLVHPSYMDVVVFDDIALRNGDNVEIIGKGEEYNNKMEIIAHRIRVID
ncbi:MAG: hypothetical protein KAK00_08275 [Nanoarchaeota archaeon]|nr:hypothetical protein [Nanoarchaeota archaeon]